MLMRCARPAIPHSVRAISKWELTLDCSKIVLETEVSNTASLRLYESLGFLRSKCLHRYYLNGNTAYRLILYLKPGNAFKVPQHPPGFGPEDIQSYV
jgi:hypothetical protein